MTDAANIKPNHKAIRTYYERRKEIAAQGVTHELAVREAFKGLLEGMAGVKKWTLVVEQSVEGMKHVVRPDGTLRDDTTLPRGYWEAKDSRDDLEKEIAAKFKRGYPQSNILFEDTRRAVLIQNGQHAGEYDLDKPAEIAALFNRFLDYRQPTISGFEQAVERFKGDVTELAKGLQERIAQAHAGNKWFQAAYAAFFELCKSSLNPNISHGAVDEMLIQHLLTERLMRTVFDNPDFVQRNAIAGEVERVITALTRLNLNRKEFLGQLDYFYEAIEAAARDLGDFSEKQRFINTVYERFFQGFAVKVADTHGIVYTPQPIVDFMCAAVEETLANEFGYALTDPAVQIIDPATGTGNFIVNLLRRIHQQDPARLADTYRERLFANEVMLLPYYIASLNIEHTYYELTGRYEPFEGLCFVDTLDLAEGQQMQLGFMNAANTERVERQKAAPITVIIGNPPYNVGQINENDNNKNRKYKIIDQKVRDTYVKDSSATNKNALYDAYVKFFRWATDRLGTRDGIVCYVSNNSFVDQIAFDGMRRHLLQDFNRIYILDLKGNVRKDSMRDGIPIGEQHTVFGLAAMVGISVTVLVRNRKRYENYRIKYYAVDWRAKRLEKFNLLERTKSLSGVTWQELKPDHKHNWLVPENADEYETYIPIGSKDAKRNQSTVEAETLFKLFSGGVKTNRDEIVYDFDEKQLNSRVRRFAEDYNGEVDRYKRAGRPSNVDDFVKYEHIKWSEGLKTNLVRGEYAEYSEARLRIGVYRPYSKRYLFFDRVLNERVYQFPHIFPTPATEAENRVIWIKVGSDWPMFALMINAIPDLLPQGGSQCFPFYVYDEAGQHRRENITDWALKQFRDHYADPLIGKWDIFHYVYALLHHPGYRERYAANLKKELPRIPLAPGFRAFAAAGQRLADLHLTYETIEPYPLTHQWTPGKPVAWRVTGKMRLSADKTAVKVNDALTLSGIPPAAHAYRLGNRSALEWIIDQYQLKTDKRSGITSDPNAYSDDEQYIARLIGRVVRVSVETVDLVASLPPFA